MNKLIIPFFLFFLFLIIPSYAYTSFSLNPFFTNDILLMDIYNNVNGTGASGYNGSVQTYNWNASCWGTNKTGCLQINSIIAPTKTQVRIGNANLTDTMAVVNNSTGNMWDMITLPANTEGIITISYRANSTITSGVTPTGNPMLFAVQWFPSYNTLVQIPMNTTNDTWYNYSAFISPATYDRAFEIYFDYSLTTANTSMLINYFKFYTVDISTYEDYWDDSNMTASRDVFCGEDALWVHDYSDTPATEPYYQIINDTKAYLIAYETDIHNTNYKNQSVCAVFRLGNLTTGGRFVSYNFMNASSPPPAINDERTLSVGYNAYKSMLLMTGSQRYDADEMSSIDLIEAMSTTNVTFTHFYEHGVANNSLIVMGNLGSTNMTWENFTKQHQGALRESIDYTGYLSNGLPAGTTFRVYSNLVVGTTDDRYTPLFPIFSSNLTPSDVWTCRYNTEALYLSNGSVVNSRYCYDCGCDANNEFCKTPSILGTYCTFTNIYQWKNENGNCTITYGTCPIGTQCRIHTSDADRYTLNYTYTIGTTNTISCYNTTSQADEYFIDDGDLYTSTNSTIPIPTETYAESISGWFGSLLGIEDEELAENMSSIIFSMIIALLIIILLASYTKISGKTLGSIFTIVLLLMLVLFTLAGWFPTWLLIVLVILSALGVAGIISGLVK